MKSEYQVDGWRKIIIKYENKDELVRHIEIIENAYDFLKREKLFRKDDNDLMVVFSENFYEDDKYFRSKQFQRQDSKQTQEPNGNFLPSDLNHLEDCVVIILNNKKIKDARISKTLEMGILVHEMVHYFDYKDVEFFKQCFNFHMYQNEKGTWQDELGGYFQMRSEMRAKSFEEMIWMQELYQNDFSTYVQKYYVQLKKNNDWYNMAHEWGQLVYWKSKLEKNCLCLDDEEIIKNKAKDIYKKEPLTIMLPIIFERDKFLIFSDYFVQHYNAFENDLVNYLDKEFGDNYWWINVK